MSQAPRRESWELAAEELVRHVRNLLENHDKAIEKALRKGLPRDEARSQLRQLERLVEALEEELWRNGQPRRLIGRYLSAALGVTLGGMLAAAGTLVATDVYNAVTDAEEVANRVRECVVREEAGWNVDVAPIADPVHGLPNDLIREEAEPPLSSAAPASAQVIDVRDDAHHAYADADLPRSQNPELPTSSEKGAPAPEAERARANRSAADRARTSPMWPASGDTEPVLDQVHKMLTARLADRRAVGRR